MPSRSRTLTDHQDIRRWAEERGAKPACVRGTGGGEDVGMVRLDFPGYTGEQSLEHIGWDDWFQKFDERKLALLVQDTTAGGERSNFNKLVLRSTARADRQQRGARGHRATSRSRSRARRSSSSSSRNRKSSSRSSRPKRSSSARSKRSSSRSASTRSKKSSAKRGTAKSKRSSPKSSSRSKRGRRTIKLTIPKDVRIEAKSRKRNSGRRAA